MKKQNKAPITAIIPCYNSEKTIQRCIESVTAQTLAVEEIIIIDDKSTDGTIEIVENIRKNHKNIKIIKLEKNSGPATARNIGWDNAKTKYIAFLDSDDNWEKNKLEIQYEFLKKNTNIELCGHDYNAPNKKKEIKKQPKKINKINILTKNYFTTSSVILKREIKDRFPSGQHYSEDYQLWAEIVLSGRLSFYMHQKLYTMHKHPYGESGLTKNLWAMEKGELNVYKHIKNKFKLNNFLYIGLILLSIGKYMRRVIITKVRRNERPQS